MDFAARFGFATLYFNGKFFTGKRGDVKACHLPHPGRFAWHPIDGITSKLIDCALGFTRWLHGFSVDFDDRQCWIADDQELTLPGRKWREANRFDVGISVIGDAYNGSHFDHRAAGSPWAQLNRDGLVSRNRDRALIATREAKW